MKNNLIKQKALFQISLLIFAVFSISLLAPSTKAAKAEQKVCCERTTAGDYCLYTERDKCDPSFRIAPVNCEQTSYCKLGCCFDLTSGRCYKSVPRRTCRIENGTWAEDKNCNIPQCKKGCCILGTECSFVTQTRCKKEAAPFEHISMIFKEDITTEKECIDQCRAAEEGCCVFEKEDISCIFTTRPQCIAENGEFYKGLYCSKPELGCPCTRHHHKGCLANEDDVYWFDSCGNKEDIALDCDYAAGTLCGQDKEGNYICKSLDCKDIYQNDASPSSGGDKKYGESWCVYDAAVGFGTDVVGSRHYRHLCINGQELVEPCKDFREELCIQGILGQEPAKGGEAFGVTGEFVEAACRDNRWEDCASCNGLTTCGGECSSLEDPIPGTDENEATIRCCRMKCCGDIYLRDCHWLEAGISEYGGNCIPHIPPGLRFWEDSAKSECNKGNLECTVKYKRKFAKVVKLGWEKWECIENCHCLEKDWIVAANTYCKSLGDCGAYFNIVGRLTKDGFIEDVPDISLEDKDVGDWETLIKPKNDTWQGIWKKIQLGLVVMLGTGIYAWIASGMEKGIFLKAATSGWSGLGAFLKSLIPYTPETKWRFPLTSLPESMAEEATKIFVKEVIKEGAIVTRIPIKLEVEYIYTNKEWYRKGVPYDIGRVKDENILKELNQKAIEEGKLVKSGIPGAEILQWVNTIATIYTIYEIIGWALTDEKKETYTITCNPWQAPTGGKDCELCLEDWKTCSEYRCKSLGQGCELINEGTDNELCVNTNPYDVNSPIITPNKDVLTKGYSLKEVDTRGYIISPDIEPFTPLTFGINTNEPAQCKISLNHSTPYDEMTIYITDSLYRYNHTKMLSVAAELVEEEALKITNNGIYNFYIRCQDKAGNQNKRAYFIRFRVKQGPDLTPPVIELTSIQNNAYIPHGITQTPLSIYLNEPANCRWSRIDTDYDSMENEFTGCAETGFDVEAVYYGLYKCSTILTNIKDNQDDIYYFKCKDQPGAEEKDRNIMQESYVFTLKGTSSLRITSIEPSGKVYCNGLLCNNATLKVITTGGAENGIATCGFSTEKTEIANMIEFLNTNSTTHTQPFIDLEIGTYNYYVGCVDAAGNSATNSTTFIIAADKTPPVITQIYKTTSMIHITLDEETNCEYSSSSFKYGNGTKMTEENSKDHEAPLDTIYYVICQDIYGNEMPIAKVYI